MASISDDHRRNGLQARDKVLLVAEVSSRTWLRTPKGVSPEEAILTANDWP